jgi:hypothetical protein
VNAALRDIRQLVEPSPPNGLRRADPRRGRATGVRRRGSHEPDQRRAQPGGCNRFAEPGSARPNRRWLQVAGHQQHTREIRPSQLAQLGSSAGRPPGWVVASVDQRQVGLELARQQTEHGATERRCPRELIAPGLEEGRDRTGSGGVGVRERHGAGCEVDSRLVRRSGALTSHGVSDLPSSSGSELLRGSGTSVLPGIHHLVDPSPPNGGGGHADPACPRRFLRQPSRLCHGRPWDWFLCRLC